MRLIADENMPRDAVEAMRQAGHDVTWIRTDAPGSSDTDILARAQREQRIVVTFDKDFGELAFRSGLPAMSGVILFRLPVPKPAQVASLIVATLASRDDWAGHFAVVEPGRIRMRALPPTAPDA